MGKHNIPCGLGFVGPDGCWVPIALPGGALNGQCLIFDNNSPLQLAWGPILKGDPGPPGTNGLNGLTPTIGGNFHWFLGGVDTGIIARGINGTNGINGRNGVDGRDGADGRDGRDGRDGVDGRNGNNGITPHIGANGNWFLGGLDTGQPAKGIDGKDGRDGLNGSNGQRGEPGLQGIQGPPGPGTAEVLSLSAQIPALLARIESLEQRIAALGG